MAQRPPTPTLGPPQRPRVPTRAPTLGPLYQTKMGGQKQCKKNKDLKQRRKNKVLKQCKTNKQRRRRGRQCCRTIT